MGKSTIRPSKSQVSKTKSSHQYFFTKKHRSELKGAMQPRVPDWWEKEIRGERPTQICKRCHAVYFDEHWHTNPKTYEAVKGRKNVKERLCLECGWVKSGLGKVNYEGEVILKNFREDDKPELLAQIRNIGKRAAKRDPEDQIIKIEDRGDWIRVTTTENQLAESIGKQISRARKGGELEIKHSHQDAPARVIWTAA